MPVALGTSLTTLMAPLSPRQTQLTVIFSYQLYLEVHSIQFRKVLAVTIVLSNLSPHGVHTQIAMSSSKIMGFSIVKRGPASAGANVKPLPQLVGFLRH